MQGFFLINAIVHRDYDRDVSTNIRVFDNRIEIASYGGLPPNTTIDTFLLGLSMPRNKNLADIFYRLELIEAFGSGIPKMTEIYKDKGITIEFRTSPSGFMIAIPNINYRNEDVPSTTIEEEHGDTSKSLLDQRAEAAAEIIQEKGSVTRQELETVWEVGRSTASKWLDQLIESGYLIRIGSGRNTRYAKRHPDG